MIYIYQDHIDIIEKFAHLEYDWVGKYVLDLGCNIGKLGRYVLARGALGYKGIEVNKDVVETANRRYPELEITCNDVNICTIPELGRPNVVVMMALLHHLTVQQVEDLFDRLDFDEVVFEVPVGEEDPKFTLYKLRTRDYYRDLLIRYGYSDVVIVKSGAKNDPYNPRLIFVGKRGE